MIIVKIDPSSRTIGKHRKMLPGALGELGRFVRSEVAGEKGKIGTIFVAEDLSGLRSLDSFSLRGLSVAGHRVRRIYGAAVLVMANGKPEDISCDWYEAFEAQAA